LSELPLTVRLPAAVSASPTVKPTGPTATPAVVTWFAIPVIVGASFTAFTVRPKLVGVLRPPSLTVIVIVAVPLWFAAGVTLTDRFAPLPPNAMLAFGTSVGLLELPLRVRFPAVVSLSPTVNAIAPVVVSSFVVTGPIEEIVGGVFGPETVNTKLLDALNAPSLTVIVIVVDPD
jgi:hypothetical protein